MTQATHALAGGILAMLMAAVVLTPSTQGGDIGYVEDFALAKDRSAALRQLIPGTEDYYYYNALHLLNTEQYDKIPELTKLWHERFNQTARLNEIQTRYALLTYDRDPKKSLEYFRNKLGLHFAHQKETVGAAASLPTTLDQKLIARATLKTRWFAQQPTSLDQFEDSALDWLATEELNWERRRHLLSRLQRPDLANLPALIVEDMKQPHPQEFGAYPVHFQLTLAQLEELLKLRPDLLNHSNYVRAYVMKLHPGADDDWKRDRNLTKAYLERLQAFAERLAPVHNAFKAHVLFHRLAFDRAQGNYDKARFIEYLKLPRRQGYMAQRMLESEDLNKHPADLNADYVPITMLPIIGADEAMVRSYLKHFLVEAANTKEFEPYINDVYLRHLFAEGKIENGLGDPESWASQLPPELFRQLKDRIDIDFAFTNKTDFAADEAVKLDLFIKNVPNLLVKVFEVNAPNFYKTQQREVDTDINLDGLIANVEKAHPYGETPFRRVGRTFEFPELTKPGLYVIDFIGGGKSSRALIRKGRLRPLVETSTAGQSITVVDDANKQVKDASVWLGGQEYKVDTDGTVTVPFTAAPGRRPIVIVRGDFASLDYLTHQPEAYHLTAGIHIDRESLLTQRVAQLLVRPGLTINGQPVSVKLLEEVRLRITSKDHAGIPTSTEVPDFKLFEDRESVHEIRTPARLLSLEVTLTAKVKALATGKMIDLAVSRSFAMNQIEQTDKIEDLHFAKFGPNYVIELLGRSGEAKPERPVQVALKHRDFKQVVTTTLKSDAQGRVHLGPLADITAVTATGPEGTAHTWHPPTDKHTYRQLMHAKAGDAVVLPYLGKAGKPDRAELALFEVRGSDIRADKFDALAVANGMLELRGLAAGDYDLWLKTSGDRIRVRVTDGPVVAKHLLGKIRHLEVPGLAPVQIEAITSEAESLVVKLRAASKFARVHVFATRYLPAYHAYHNLDDVRDSELQGVYPGHADSVYLTGRNIGDEYRYVLDRRGQRKFPGNMLDRPQLLLNPWAVRTTETGEQLAAGGDLFGGVGAATPPVATAPPAPKPEAPPGGGGGIAAHFENLDFLADASAVLLNLVPDGDGVIRIPRKDLGPHAQIHVVAVDPLGTTYRSTTLPEQVAKFADLRLRSGLDPTKHFTQQKQVTVLAENQAFSIDDVAGSRFEAYDSLPKLYALYATLSKDPKLAEFSFILTWHKLKPEEKRALYSKYACHELSYFLFKKDVPFFQNVVRPYLANKKDKTFLDHWLLNDDVSRFLQPWEFGRLNTVERTLLAQRIDGEAAKTSRHLSDLFRLLPPNPERGLVLFDTAVASGGLEKKSTFGFEQEKLKQQSEWQRRFTTEPGQPGLHFQPPQGGPMGGAPGAPGGGGGAGFGGGFGGGRPGAPPAAGAAPRDMPQAKTREGRSAGKGGEAKDEKAQAERVEEQLQKMDADKENKFFDDEARKKVVRQLYRKLDPTQEWAENNYYHLLIQQQIADLVPVGQLWLDYAKHDKGPFLSRHLADASRNFTEMMFALSVLDLPAEAGKHDVKFDAGKMTLKPAGPMIAFHEEVRPADAAANAPPVLVSQNFYKHGDRFIEENGEKLDKFVTAEFVVHTVYGCQIVVTNPTSSRQKLSVLVQLPIGAIPVANGQFTKSVQLDLEPYRTATIDYFFYFPLPGKFAQFPAHVAKSEKFIAAAKAMTFEVVEKPTKLDTTSWAYVSQNGTNEEVVAFLNRENINALNLEKIAFRMKDRAFFETVTKLLRDRHVYHPTLWSYGLFHADATVARQYLMFADGIIAEAGRPITSPILGIDPVARHQYEHLEYKPLVNARAHALGQRRQIVNDRLYQQYHNFLKVLSYRRTLDDNDLLAAAYYLLLQDRIEEALAAFERVNPDRVATKMQYDYCAAYLALFSDDPQRARTIADKYINYPVDKWKNLFVNVITQLNEAEGKAAQVVDPLDAAQRQGALAATEPHADFTLEGKTINLSWQNLDEVRVNFYLMDVELLFSRNPFVQQSGNQFAFIKPNATQVVKLPAMQSKLAVKLPDEFAKRNVLVEVQAAGKSRSAPYYANTMDLKMTDNYGQLKVTDGAGGKPLAKVYVKVYARLANGEVKFHKDGYTDLRGRFDYASVNTPERLAIERFAVLVLSEEKGALIREAAPPQQ